TSQHHLFPHFIGNLVFFTFLDEPVVFESLAQPQPSKENDENEHRNDRDIIRLGQDLQKIMPTTGFFHNLSTRKIDVILKKVFDILAKVNVTRAQEPTGLSIQLADLDSAEEPPFFISDRCEECFRFKYEGCERQIFVNFDPYSRK